MLILLLILISTYSFSYETRYKNFDLDSQIEGEKRVFGKLNDKFTFLINGYGLFRNKIDPKSGAFEGDSSAAEGIYYHSGYGVEALTEYKLTDNVTINNRLLNYNPATSYSSGTTNFFYSATSIMGRYNFKELVGFNLPLVVRILDLDQQTVGSGLVISEKNMSAVKFTFKLGDVVYNHIQAGTGVLTIGGDLGVYEFIIKNKYGLTILKQFENAIEKSEPIYTLFYNHNGLKFEFGNHENGFAYMARFEKELSKFTKYHFDYRRYDDNFGEILAGRIDNDQLYYDQEYLPYVDFMNLINQDNNVEAVSFFFETEQFFYKNFFSVFLSNELVYTKYKDIAQTQKNNKELRSFYHVAFNFYPLKNNNEKVSFYLKNKITAAEGNLNFQHDYNGPSLYLIDTFGVEARFYY